MNLAKAGILALAILSGTTAFAADHGGSMEDQMACTPDVYKLCASLIPDEDAIVACLEKNKAVLSPACHKVFSQPSPHANNSQNDDN